MSSNRSKNENSDSSLDDSEESSCEVSMSLKGQKSQKDNLRKVFNKSDPHEAKILNLVEQIEATGDSRFESELVSFAKLRPRAFSSKIRAYFEKVALSNNVSLRRISVDIVLLLSNDHLQKLKIAVKACAYGMTVIVSDFITDNAELLTPEQVRSIIASLAYRAITYTLGDFTPSQSDKRPILAVAKHHSKEIVSVVLELLDHGSFGDLELASHIVRFTARQNVEICSAVRHPMLEAYMRLLVRSGDYSSDVKEETVDLLQEVAVVLYEIDPEACESIIDSSDIEDEKLRNKIRVRIYKQVLLDRGNELSLKATPARILAFRKLLQIAVNNVVDVDFHEATDFYTKAKLWMNEVAEHELDTMFREAVRLSRSDDAIEQEVIDKGLVDTVPPPLREVLTTNAIGFNDDLRDGLIDWVIALARDEGTQGVQNVLGKYEEVEPKNTEFKKAFLKKITKLITKDIATINGVLRHGFTGMSHADPYIRGYAIQALVHINSSAGIKLPDVVFESWLTLLNDPHQFVHQSAVFAIKPNLFPEKFKVQLNMRLLVLLSVYHKKADEPKFMVRCIDKFANGLNEEEVKDIWGEAIPHFISSLPPPFAGQAFDCMPFRMRLAKGYSASIARILTFDNVDKDIKRRIRRNLFEVPVASLQECVEFISVAVLKTEHSAVFRMGTPIALMTIAGAYEQASKICKEVCDELPSDKEYEAHRLFMKSLQMITQFDAVSSKTKKELARATDNWKWHLEAVGRAEKFVSEKANQVMEEELDRSGDSQECSESNRSLKRHYENVFEASSIWGVHVLYRNTFSTRLDGLTAIHSRDTEKAEQVARQLQGYAFSYGDYIPSRALQSMSKVYQCLSKIYRWRNAKIESDPKAEKFIESARFIADEQLAGDSSLHSEHFLEVFQAISELESVKVLKGIETKVSSIPIPVSVSSPPIREKSKRIELTPKPDYNDNFAILTFKLNGQPAQNLDQLDVGVLHDVELEIDLPYWPEAAEKLRVEPVSVFSSEYYDFPAFVIAKSGNDRNLKKFTCARQLLLKVPQDQGATPVEFRFRAIFDPDQDRDRNLNLTGQDTLRLFCKATADACVVGEEKFRIDVASEDKDIALIGKKLDKDFGVDFESRSSTIIILDKLSWFARQAHRTDRLAKVSTEEEFRQEVAYHFDLSLPNGVEILQETKAGRGKVDLLVGGIPIELKVELKTPLSKAKVSKYVKQAVEYALALQKKVGILCILDSSPKKQNSKPIEKLRWICSSSWKDLGVVVVVVVIQGRFPAPSDLSR